MHSVASLRNVILKSHEIELVSSLYTVGVIIAFLCGTKSYTILFVLPITILIFNSYHFVFILCGVFAYMSYSMLFIDVQIPQFITGLSDKLCSFIDGIPMHNTGLVKAFLQGDKSDLDSTVIKAFRASGASHLLALSGLHMGIIYAVIAAIIKPMKNHYIRFSIIVFISLVFTLMTGARPSIVRAFLFITVSEIYHLQNKHAPLSKTLSIALLIQLIMNPSYIESIGFQLSYSAVLGIMVLCPVFEKMVNFKGFMQKLWSLISVSIACQIFTAPLAWYYFHTFPKYFLLTNLIAIPLTTAFMVMSIIVIVLSVIGVCPIYLCMFTDDIGDVLLYSLKIIEML